MCHFPAARHLYKCVIILCFLQLAGCDGLPPVRVQLGSLAEDPAPGSSAPAAARIYASEQQAAAAGREVLLAGGNAADAAAAVGFALAVTAPSSAGLEAPGICVVRDEHKSLFQGVDFGHATTTAGLSALFERFGSRPWSSLVAPAERLALFGYRVSRSLALDLETYGGTLASRPDALARFMTAERRLVAEGDVLRESRVAGSLSRIRMRAETGKGDPAWYTPVADGNVRIFAPGTSGFVIVDKTNLIVGCVFTLGQPFGNGRTSDTTGSSQHTDGASRFTLEPEVRALFNCLDAPGKAEICSIPALGFIVIP